MVLVNTPIVPANLFVAKAAAGGRPKNKRAGVEIKPPPPTTESMNAAKKPNSKSKRTICKLNSSIKHLPHVIIYSDYLNSNYIKSSCKYVNDENFK
jgi:hypothetical protein